MKKEILDKFRKIMSGRASPKVLLVGDTIHGHFKNHPNPKLPEMKTVAENMSGKYGSYTVKDRGFTKAERKHILSGAYYFGKERLPADIVAKLPDGEYHTKVGFYDLDTKKITPEPHPHDNFRPSEASEREFLEKLELMKKAHEHLDADIVTFKRTKDKGEVA